MPHVHIIACPACGASLSVEEDDTRVKCQFCGQTVGVQLPETKQEGPPPPGRRATGEAAARAKYGGLMALMGLVFLLLIGGAAAYFSLQAADVSDRVVSVVETSVQLPAGLTLPAPVAADAGFATVVLSFGGTGTGPGKFDDARSIAVDGEGNIYVAEYTRGRVQRFDAAGQFLRSWMAEGETPLRALAADRQGNVYVVRQGKILRYHGASGELLERIEAGSVRGRYDDVVPLPDGNLLACACFGADDLVFLGSQGEELRRIPSAVSAQTNQNPMILRVAADGLGDIYVLSSRDSAIFRFTADGRFVDRFGGEGDEPGQLRAPGVLAVDSQSRVYVSDFNGIQIFDAEGRYLRQFEVPNRAYVLGLAITDDDEILAVAGDKVFKFVLAWPGQ